MNDMNQLLSDYASFVQSRMKSGDQLLSEMTAEKAALGHTAHGIGTESGELIDVIKKHVDYGKPLDREHLKEEAGDLLFYLFDALHKADLTVSEVLAHNVGKLTKRYAEKYTNEEASARADKA